MFWFKSISAGKMKDETDGLSFKDFFVIKPKTYSFLVDDFSQQKKAQGMNKNVAAKTSSDKQKNFLQKKKCLRYSMNRSQSQNYRIRTYGINKISLSCFNDNIHFLHNRFVRLTLGAYVQFAE